MYGQVKEQITKQNKEIVPNSVSKKLLNYTKILIEIANSEEQKQWQKHINKYK